MHYIYERNCSMQSDVFLSQQIININTNNKHMKYSFLLFKFIKVGIGTNQIL